MRLFAAIDLPESVRALLAQRGEALGAALKTRVRRVPSENLHLTLFFLGQAERASVPRIEDAMQSVAAAVAPFQLRLTAGGAFPPAGRARVLWAGVEPIGEVTSLHDALQRELDAVGVADADAARFHPHVTLARCRPPLSRALTDEALASLHDLGSEPFAVTAMTLYESHTLPSGARHDTLGRYDLERPGGDPG